MGRQPPSTISNDERLLVAVAVLPFPTIANLNGTSGFGTSEEVRERTPTARSRRLDIPSDDRIRESGLH
jgi:hypothetical protein